MPNRSQRRLRERQEKDSSGWDGLPIDYAGGGAPAHMVVSGAGWASTPSHIEIDTDVFTLDVKYAADAWPQSEARYLAGTHIGGNGGPAIYHTAQNKFQYGVSPAPGSFVGALTEAVTVPNGDPQWVRLEYPPAKDDVYGWLSTDGVVWTDPTSRDNGDGAFGALYFNGLPLYVGGHPSYIIPVAGKIYKVIWKNQAGETVSLFNPNGHIGESSWMEEETGEVWTLSGDAEIVADA